MPSFSDLKNAYKMQKEAKKVKKELDAIHVEAEAQGIFVVVSGQQEIIDIQIAADVPQDQIAPRLKDALNRAMKKAQVVASEKMQGIMSQMGLSTQP